MIQGHAFHVKVCTYVHTLLQIIFEGLVSGPDGTTELTELLKNLMHNKTVETIDGTLAAETWMEATE